jgi:cell division protein FtsL
MREAQQLISAYAQAPWRKQLQLIGLFSLVVVLFALVASLYLIVSSQAATYGREIQNMQVQIEDLQRRNADLNSQLARLTSAEVMESRAQELGLQPALPDQIIYLKVNGYSQKETANFAAPEVAAVPSTKPGINTEFRQTLLDWFGSQMFDPEFAAWLDEVTQR